MSEQLTRLDIDPPDPPTQEELESFWSGQQHMLGDLLAAKIPAGATVAMLDYPVHGNTGDHLIMLGTERWTIRHGLNVVGRWHADNFRYPRFSKDTILVCHGGGNLGDLYRYQRFRERVIRAYPDHRVVILPQTIYYRSPERLQQSAAQMRSHADLHLFVRDRRSLELAREAFPTCHSVLAPDMAAFLFPLEQQLDCELPRTARRELFCLFRRDMERTDVAARAGLKGQRCLDWDDLAPQHRLFILGVIACGYAFGKIVPHRYAARWWHNFCRRRAVHAAQEMAASKCVLTNRLHGHILACLLGVPNLVFDNSYGKCTDYFQAWHESLSFTRLISDR